MPRWLYYLMILAVVAPILATASQSCHNARNLRQEVGGQQAGVADLGTDVIRGGSMQVDAGAGDLEGLQALGEEAGDHARQDVAGAGGSEGRIGVPVDARAPIRMGDNG